MKHKISEREEILLNIAAALAKEVYVLHTFLPSVQEYRQNPHSFSHITVDSSGVCGRPNCKVGDIVLCYTSLRYRQLDPWVLSIVHEIGFQDDPDGLVLRAIGTNDLCNYSNESFIVIGGFREEHLWEGDKKKFAAKVYKVMGRIADYFHRFRELRFIDDNTAAVVIGEAFGGALNKPSKPYSIPLKFDKKTTLKDIKEQVLKGGYGKRKFEPADTVEETYPNPQPITRDSLVATLNASGIELKNTVGSK